MSVVNFPVLIQTLGCIWLGRRDVGMLVSFKYLRKLLFSVVLWSMTLQGDREADFDIPWGTWMLMCEYLACRTLRMMMQWLWWFSGGSSTGVGGWFLKVIPTWGAINFSDTLLLPNMRYACVSNDQLIHLLIYPCISFLPSIQPASHPPIHPSIHSLLNFFKTQWNYFTQLKLFIWIQVYWLTSKGYWS